MLLGYYREGTRYVPFLLDGDNRLVMQFVTWKYYARSPIVVPTTVGILESGPGSGTRVVTNINVVNVTGNPVSLKLHVDEEEATDYNVFGICGEDIEANSMWQWEGEIALESSHVWGVAGDANALYAFFTVRDERDAVR
jgi:hypothetical protein